LSLFSTTLFFCCQTLEVADALDLLVEHAGAENVHVRDGEKYRIVSDVRGSVRLVEADPTAKCKGVA